MTAPRLLLLVLGWSLACGGLSEQQPDLAHPLEFHQDGLRFGYPGNWTFSTDVEPVGEMEILTVTLESPGDALAIVQRYPPGIAPGLDDATKIMVDAMTSTVSEESAGIAAMDPPTYSDETRNVAGSDRSVRVVDYSLKVFSVDVPHQLRLYDVGDVIVITNVANEDAALASQGFHQILDTLTVP